MPLHTAEERRQIALSVERVIQGQGPDLLPFRFFQVAALFYPGDTARAKTLEAKLQEALAAGDLITVIPHDQRGLLLTELAAWPDCPAVPSNSPLRYWLPKWLHEADDEQANRNSLSPSPVRWLELEQGTTEIEFQELPFLLAEARAKPGEDEVITAARAIQFEGELGSLVDKGLVPLKNPLTGGPHEFPHGHARDTAIFRLEDLDAFLRQRYAIGVRVKSDGTEQAKRTSLLASETTRESTEARRARRYQMCLDAGLKMPDDDYGPMPRGIGMLAKQEGISRQAFTEDMKMHINRLNQR